jgi:hypothetical protein
MQCTAVEPRSGCSMFCSDHQSTSARQCFDCKSVGQHRQHLWQLAEALLSNAQTLLATDLSLCQLTVTGCGGQIEKFGPRAARAACSWVLAVFRHPLSSTACITVVQVQPQLMCVLDAASLGSLSEACLCLQLLPVHTGTVTRFRQPEHLCGSQYHSVAQANCSVQHPR